MPFVERLHDPDYPEYDEYENAFDIPLQTSDEYVWRYMAVEKYLSFLENSGLYCTRVDRFADEFEGALPPSEFAGSDTKRIKTIYDKFYQLVHINCWNINNTESLTMWNLYAPKGVVVKTSMNSLLQSLDAEEDTAIHAAEVEYIDYTKEDIGLIEENDGSISGNLLEPYKYKREYFSEEKEMRLITNAVARESLRDDLENGSFDTSDFSDFRERSMRVDVDINECVKEVLVHPKADESTIEAIKLASDRTHGIGDRVGPSSIRGVPSLQR